MLDVFENAKAVFLDRDGTLIRHVHYLHEPEKVELLPGVAEALRLLLDRNVKLFLFTNQSGVNRGLFTLTDVEAVNQRMLDLIGLGDDIFTDICIATEMPSDEPVYRKPSPRFILESLAKHRIPKENAVMVGDNPTDWEAGNRAGIQVVAIESSIHRLSDCELGARSFTAFSGISEWLFGGKNGSSIAP